MRLAEAKLPGLLLTAALLLMIAGVPTVVRVPVAVAVVLAVGHAWALAVFPRPLLGPPERLVASVALAITALIMISLAIQVSPWRLTARSWIVGLGLVGIGAWRIASERADPEWSSSPKVDRTASVWRRNDARAALVLVAVLGVVGVIARQPLPPPDGVDGFTQLWLVPAGSGGELGVASFEMSPTTYRLELRSGTELVDEWLVQLRPDERWTVDVSVTGQVLEARLFRDGDATAYRAVRTPLGASPP